MSSTPPFASPRRRHSSRPALLALLLVAASVTMAAPTSAAPPVPRLKITQVEASGTPTAAGTTVKTTVVVKNPTAVRKPSRSVRVFMTNGPRTFSLGSVQVRSLKPGESTPVTLSRPAPLAAPAGPYAVRACLEPSISLTCRLSGPTVTIAPARLVAAPSTLALGQVPLGATSDPRSVTIINRGHARTGVLATNVTGDGFAVTDSTCGDSLDPGDSCTTSVAFTPDAPGAATGTLTLTGRRDGTTTVGLTGTGVGAATLIVSPDEAAFDDTLVGQQSDPVVLTVINAGNIATGVPDVELAPTTTGHFDVDGTTCTTALLPGATCTVTVVFAPTAAGETTAGLAVSATPGGSVVTALSGTGLAPAQLVLTPPSAAFGSEIVGDTTDPVTFTVTNTGDVSSGTPTAVLGGIDADQFTLVSNGCTSAVDAHGTCTVDVAFSPTATGSASASLDVSATPGGSDTSPLTGSGETQPSLAISEPTYNYGFTGSPTEHTFTVTNTGTTASGAPSAVVTGSGAFTVTSDTCTAPLPGGGTCAVGVTYTGSGQGEQTAQLSVSATPGGTVTADLTGSPQALSVEPTSHDYGGVTVGDSSAPASFTLTNHRLTPVQIDGESVSGPFQLATSCFDVAIPAGGTCTFSARFAPTDPGPANGAVNYFAQGSQTQLVLSGEGLTPAAFSLSPSTVDFGAYQPGDIGTQQVTVTNTGTQASAPISFAITGSNANEFYTDSTDCPTTLAGGASCTVTVAFAPITLGDKTATFTTNGAPGGTTAMIGLGAPAGVTLYPVSHNYGAVPVGGAAYFTFRVVNTTNNGEDMNSASSGPPFPLELNNDFTCVLVISTIQPHRWCTMTLSFKPQSVGPFSTTLTAGGTNFNTQSQLFGTGVPARGTRTSAHRPMTTSVALRNGKVAVRRE